MGISRSSFLFTFFVFWFSLVVVRLFYWQIISGGRLQQEASRQHFVELTIPASRGTIVDFQGNPVVVNQPAYLVYGEPRNIQHIPSFAREVASILGKDEEELARTLSDPQRVWVPLDHKVELPIMTRLKSLNLTGLGFEKEPKRFYPEASTAAHILGFVGRDLNGVDHGYFGLEGYYDRQLRGIDGSRRLGKDARGASILLSEEERLPPEDGRTLVLWMEKPVQQIVEKRLKEGMNRYGAKEGSVVIMDPVSGGILAMASFPNYDPKNYATFDTTLDR